MNIHKIKNVLFWGNQIELATQVLEIEKCNRFNLFFASTFIKFHKILESHMIHLIIIDSSYGIDGVNEVLEFFHDNGYANIPMLLMMDEESIEQRCEFYTQGISSFINKGNTACFIDTVRRLERDLSFHEGLKSMSIAVLDDDKFQLTIIKDILDRNTIFNVDFYSDPKSLLESQKAYDVYLIDLILPEIDGGIVMLEMRKKNENAIIIGISSIEKKSTIARVLSIGANDYISKPINEQVFMAKLYSNSRVLMLIKENEVKNIILQELAIKDGLTNLYNHKHIHEMLDLNIKLSKRYCRPLSVIMFDIDNFKMVNDTFGHQFGDEVLSQVAQIIKKTARNTDIIGRYGGEEFIVILPETDDREALILAERIRKEIQNNKFRNDVSITISGGVSLLEEDSEQVIYDADKLLYKSKHTGKNKIEYISRKIKNIEESYLMS